MSLPAFELDSWDSSNPGETTVIAGVTIHSVSSEAVVSGWDLNATHLVDGSGLLGYPPVHMQNTFSNQNSWQTISQTGTGNVQFDLGSTFDLDHLQVWNLNFYSPYNGRGARSVDIYTSTDAITWTFAENREFPMASGADWDAGFEIDAREWDDARYVQFDIRSNWGGTDNAGHVGLSEVIFHMVPEPSAMGLIAAALLSFGVRRRRCRS